MRYLIMFLVAVSAIKASSEEWPDWSYFKGLENRLEQADAVVIGEARIEGIRTEAKELDYPVTVQLSITKQLKGSLVPPHITYDVEYHSHGLGSFEKFTDRKPYTPNERMAFNLSRRVAGWGEEMPEHIVVFFDNKEGVWEPWYVLWETTHEGSSKYISKIYSAEQTRKECGSIEHIVNLLSLSEHVLTRQYAVRTILKSDHSWAEICSILSEKADLLNDPYFAGVIAAHYRVRQLGEADMILGWQLLGQVLATIPDSKKEKALKEVSRHCPEFKFSNPVGTPASKPPQSKESESLQVQIVERGNNVGLDPESKALSGSEQGDYEFRLKRSSGIFWELIFLVFGAILGVLVFFRYRKK